MKILLVEGINDKFVINKLLKRRKIEFENFTIKDCRNVNNLLNILPEVLQFRTYEDAIGIIVDGIEEYFHFYKLHQSAELPDSVRSAFNNRSVGSSSVVFIALWAKV